MSEACSLFRFEQELANMSDAQALEINNNLCCTLTVDIFFFKLTTLHVT